MPVSDYKKHRCGSESQLNELCMFSTIKLNKFDTGDSDPPSGSGQM